MLNQNRITGLSAPTIHLSTLSYKIKLKDQKYTVGHDLKFNVRDVMIFTADIHINIHRMLAMHDLRFLDDLISWDTNHGLTCHPNVLSQVLLRHPDLVLILHFPFHLFSSILYCFFLAREISTGKQTSMWRLLS